MSTLTQIAIGIYFLATVLAIGFIAYAALVDPETDKPWKWGDKPRRPGVPHWVSNTIGAMMAGGAVIITEALMRGMAIP